MAMTFREALKQQIEIRIAPAPLWSVILCAAFFFWAVAWTYNAGVHEGQLSALKSAYDIVRRNSRAF